MKAKEKARFFYQFAALLNSGISVQQSLNLSGQNSNSSFQRYLARMSAAVGAGQDLASAMTLKPRYFDDWTISLIRLAEYSGSVSETCRRLALAAEVQQRRERLYGSVRLSAIAIIWSLLLVMIVIFQKTDNAIMQSSFWLNGLGVGLLLVGLSLLDSLYPGRVWKLLAVGLPGLDKVIEARSLLYLAELELPLNCGVSMLTALEMVRDRIPDPIMAAKLAIATKSIRLGHPLSHSLQGKIPPIAIQMIRTGEETGNLDVAFHQLAEYYEGELERSIRQLEGILRPLSILAMGGLVVLLGIGLITSLINSLPG